MKLSFFVEETHYFADREIYEHQRCYSLFSPWINAVESHYEKVFDTLNHRILLSKLCNYGIRGVVYNWFKLCLTNCKQTVLVNCTISDKEVTLYVVPQGSILGLLLFFLYINDIHKKSSVFFVCRCMLYVNKNLRKLEVKINT